MSKLRLTLVKSTIHRPQSQKSTVEALGMKKIRQSVEVEENPQLAGMIKKVEHLLKIEKI